MTAPLSVRPAAPADAEAVVDLVQDAYRGEGGAGRWTTEAHLVRGQRTTAAEVVGHIRAERSAVLVTEDTDGLLACCHIKALPPRPPETDDAPPRAYFGMFAVRPGHQGGGIGRALVTAGERWARDAWDAAVMEMQVIDGREELLAWYDRLGYQRTGRSIPFPLDNEDDRPIVAGLSFVVLEKALTP